MDAGEHGWVLNRWRILLFCFKWLTSLKFWDIPEQVTIMEGWNDYSFPILKGIRLFSWVTLTLVWKMTLLILFKPNAPGQFCFAPVFPPPATATLSSPIWTLSLWQAGNVDIFHLQPEQIPHPEVRHSCFNDDEASSKEKPALILIMWRFRVFVRGVHLNYTGPHLLYWKLWL